MSFLIVNWMINAAVTANGYIFQENIFYGLDFAEDISI